MVKVSIKKKFKNFSLDISFESNSRRIGILGASGSGKSITLKSIAGIIKPDDGLIEVDGKELFNSQKHINIKPQKRNIGYMFQNYALFPTMTVEKNIGSGLIGEKSDNKKRISYMIERFNLSGYENHYPGELSGGQQQRVAIARALVYEPDVILLDEPFSALDMYLRREMEKEIKNILSDYKGTVIIVSHNPREIYNLSDEIIVMDKGHMAENGKTKVVMSLPESDNTKRLLGFNVDKE